MDTKARNGNVTVKVFIDVILLSIFAAFLALFFNYLTPFKRGFFCDDEEIMYPRKDETITDGVLWTISILVPVGLMSLTEAFRHLKGMDTSRESEVYFCGFNVPYVFQRLYLSGGIFLFGIIMTEIASDYLKNLVGRLRPSFLELCKPDFNCSEVANPHFFVEKYTCTADLADKNDLRLSFPSGHTSVSTYAMVYAALYLQRRIDFDISALLKPLMQFLLLLLAAYISLTRIQDNKHHWNDIAAGFILGLTICLIMVFTQTDLFKAEPDSSSASRGRKFPKIESP